MKGILLQQTLQKKKRKWLVTKKCSCKVLTKDLTQIIKDGSSMQWFEKKCFQSFHLNGQTTVLYQRRKLELH